MKHSKAFVYILFSGLITFIQGTTQQAYAVLNLPDSPLFLGSSPQPNIMFAVDDSGSMDWEILKSSGAEADHAAAPNRDNIDLSPNDNDEDRELCAGYNVLAYDPNVTYTPWIGEDDAGNPYGNMSITAARNDPQSTSGATNLLSVTSGGKATVYGVWVDAPPLGVYNAGECPIAGNVGADFGDRDFTADARWVSVDTLSASEQTNFANWYSYYRKREYVLKRAMSELIDESSARIGLATLHDNNDVGTPVKDMTVQANKDDLMEEVFNINSDGRTPLRALLNNVGKYFDDTDGGNAPSALGFTDASPILSESLGGECQQNFAVLMSDGFWNGSLSGVGNEDADGTGNDTTYDGGPHADTYSNTLADVAMKYYEKDLSSLDNFVPEIENLDDNTTQHMVTYTVSFGLAGTGLTTPADHESTTPAPPWTDPISNDEEERLDDMQHAAFNGRGLFLNAANPEDFITSFTDAFADIEKRTSFSATAVAINSTVLRTSSRLFTAQFNSEDWTGELRSFSLNTDGTLDQEQWEASTSLGVSPAVADRDIFTLVDKSGTLTKINFDDTDTDLITAVGSAAIINYTRGVQSMEQQNGGTFRDRESLLADIIQSSPVSAGAENFSYDILAGTEGSSYTSFLATKTSTFTDNNGDPFSAVYVGTNGGMLHAFDSRNGTEIFAYVPMTLHGDLNLLTDPDYGHRFYVNSSGFVGDAFIDVGNGNEWRSLYASGLGEGGRAIFALDVTNPFSSTPTNTVLWEKSSADYPALGFVKHRPRVARMNNGDWAVIFGNGFNSTGERAQLFILDAEDGSVIKIIDTEVGSAADSNGLSEPFLLDIDGNRTVDFIYAGDLKGNIWKFDVSTSNSNNWKSEFTQGTTPKPFYTALDADGNPQPITSRPVLATHPDGGFMVMFGTGKYLEASDNIIPADPDVQTFYGVRDNGSQVTAGRSDLVEQKILAEIDVTDDNGDVVNTARIVSENTVDYSSKEGWYIDLVSPPVPPATDPIEQGEMVIADPLTRFGRAIFTTFIPGATPCDQGGQSVIMEVDAVSGARLQNSVFDFNNDGVIDADDLLNYSGSQVPGSGIFIPATLASPAVISAQDASMEFKQTSGLNTEVTTTMESTGGLTVGRQSWRQLR